VTFSISSGELRPKCFKTSLIIQAGMLFAIITAMVKQGSVALRARTSEVSFLTLPSRVVLTFFGQMLLLDALSV
jgi:hypothetical protein